MNLKASCRDGVTNSPSAVRGCRKWRRQLGVGALRRRLGAGWGRLARVPARSRRRGGLFQNSSFLKCARHLHAGVNQFGCTSRVSTIRATTCRLPVGLAGGGLTSSKRTAQSSSRSVWPSKRHWLKEFGERLPYVVSLFLRKLGRWAHWSAPQLPEGVSRPPEGWCGTRQQLVAERRRLSRIPRVTKGSPFVPPRTLPLSRAQRSGASRSSSPAIPTRVNRA